MIKAFDWRYLLLAVVANGVPVFFINLGEGGSLGASLSGIVQLFVSASLAGFTMPFSVRNATHPSLATAFLRSSLLMAIGVATYGGLLHYVFGTPDLDGTIAWNFGLNLSVGVAVIALKRNESDLPWPLNKLAKRL